MKAKSDVYIKLQGIYKAKARKDAAEVLALARLQEGGMTATPDDVALFCKNAAFVRLVGTRSEDPSRLQKLASKLLHIIGSTNPILTRNFRADIEYANDEVAEQVSMPLSLFPIYLALRATSQKPGATEDELVAEIEALVPSAAGRMSTRLAAREVYRAGGSELHNTSAVTGGMVAQEIIKIVTRQYVPIDNMCIFDAIGSRCQVMRL
jgi:amyloid beta precursor protein binding protein 1